MENLFPNTDTELQALYRHREHHHGIGHGQRLAMVIIREQ